MLLIILLIGISSLTYNHIIKANNYSIKVRAYLAANRTLNSFSAWRFETDISENSELDISYTISNLDYDPKMRCLEMRVKDIQGNLIETRRILIRLYE